MEDTSFVDEINLLEFFSYIKKHFVFFALVVLFVLIIGLFYFMVVQRPIYSSRVSLTLTGIESQDSKITTNDITLNTKMLPTYQGVITSRRVLEQVVNNLKLDRSISTLANNIKISAATDSMILNITVTDSNRLIARDIANEVASIFSEEIQTLYNVKNVRILDKAVASSAPKNMNYIKFVVVSLLFGIVIALILLFVIFFFDNTIKSVEQIDSKMGLVVLGSIPDYNVLNKKGARK